MDFISDDYLALALDPEPRVYRLYSTAKLDPRSLNLYPDLTARCRTVHQPGFDKVVLFLEDGYRRQLRESLPLKLVLKPNISEVPETTLGLAEPREIERALASETLMHLPHAGVQTVEFLDRVSHKVPGAAIQLGTDRARIVTAIQKAVDAPITVDLPRAAAGERRPFISLIVHFHQEDCGELWALATDIEAQRYPRTEFIVMVSGPACAMADDIANLPGSVRLFPFKDPVVNAEAWNRGIRESFAELLVLVEPGDRFAPGALDVLVSACELESEAAWVRGRVLSSGPQDHSLNPLRGALIRKSAFRECGLFHTDAFRQGRAHRDWFKRVAEKPLVGRHIETVTLHACATAAQFCSPPHKVDLGFLKAQLDRRRQKILE
jgi:hypothetical protein